MRGVPQAGHRLQLMQGLRTALLSGVHSQTRRGLPELRLEANLIHFGIASVGTAGFVRILALSF